MPMRCLCAFFFITFFALCANAADVSVHWLGNETPAIPGGVSWGVPWPKGAIHPDDTLSLLAADGKSVPMQTWPLAYWPDGSLKWSGHAITATAGLTGPLQLTTGPADSGSSPLQCTSDADAINIDAGAVRCKILKHGSTLFDSLYVGNRKVAQDAKLIAILEDRSQLESQGILRERQFVSQIDQVTLEQSGPIRAVVKITGSHHAVEGDQTILPFVVRLYFFAGSPAIRVVHSFIFDGDAQSVFIKGLGLSISVPFQEELHNRHIRFAGDEGGIWDQPVRLLPGYRNTPNAATYAQHIAGQRMPNLASMSAQARTAVLTVPVWNDFKLAQLGPDSFSIFKRTSSASSWLHVDDGHRSKGLAVLGDVSGAIAVGVKSFWQKYPSEIEIDNAASATGEMKIWLWSPDSPAMDLRSYDTVPHGLTTNYEDWKPGWDTPTGVANTADLTLWAFASIPSNADLVKMTHAAGEPPLLVCDPTYYHDVGVFGYWSLPDRSSPAKKWIEDQIDGLISFYQQQVEERHWYGFWNFGDVMHNYDFGRHVWRYDVGGWAWMNGELMPDTLLYYSFLRSGRADIFRMAEAMTRQNSEVDAYHIGPFAPLGSRHAVDHWGDGAKQPRISQSGLRRFYYYLTTDDRVGDLMREQLTADYTYALVKLYDPGHLEPGQPIPPVSMPPSYDPAHPELIKDNLVTNTSFGTDWTSYAGNWMTQWERTGDTQWRDKIIAGMKSMMTYSAPGELGGGPYDPRTGRFTGGGGGGRAGYFDMIFGGPESLFELQTMIDDPQFWSRWANTCEDIGRNSNGNQMTAPRTAAYAAYEKKDAALGALAWDKLIGNGMSTPLPLPALIQGPDVLNPQHDPAFLGRSVGWQLHGPASVQWSLNALETLQLAGQYLPAWEAAHPSGK